MVPLERRQVRGLSKKVLLRKAAEPLLPREVVHGRKRGFSIPAAAWLRGELEPFARATLSPETLRSQGFFEPVPVTRAVSSARISTALTVVRSSSMAASMMRRTDSGKANLRERPRPAATPVWSLSRGLGIG